MSKAGIWHNCLNIFHNNFEVATRSVFIRFKKIVLAFLSITNTVPIFLSVVFSRCLSPVFLGSLNASLSSSLFTGYLLVKLNCCLSVRLSVCMFVCLSLSLVSLSLSLSISLSFSLSFWLIFFLPIFVLPSSFEFFVVSSFLPV